MRKQKVKFVIYTHYIPTNPDGSCVFDRFDVTYHVDEVAYVYLTNAVKYAKRRYGGKDRDFCVAVRDEQYNSIVLYKTPNYRLIPGQKDASVQMWCYQNGQTLSQDHSLPFTIAGKTYEQVKEDVDRYMEETHETL